MIRVRTAPFGLLVIAMVVFPFFGSAAENSRKPRHSAPAHLNRAAPDVTATITKPPTVPKTPPISAGFEEIPPPFTLPNAPRAKMRACGATWRDMKLAGTTGDDDWRDFAMKCLVAK